ncbi:23803_t:CDS:2, partial [Racocetra persica]
SKAKCTYSEKNKAVCDDNELNNALIDEELNDSIWVDKKIDDKAANYFKILLSNIKVKNAKLKKAMQNTQPITFYLSSVSAYSVAPNVNKNVVNKNVVNENMINENVVNEKACIKLAIKELNNMLEKDNGHIDNRIK